MDQFALWVPERCLVCDASPESDTIDYDGSDRVQIVAIARRFTCRARIDVAITNSKASPKWTDGCLNAMLRIEEPWMEKT